MTKEQFAILLKAKHIMVPQAENAIAYLNTCDVETAVQGHYDLYLVAHNEFNHVVSDMILKSLKNLIPKTNKTDLLANIYCIMAADYVKKGQFNQAITLYYEYKNLQLDNHKLDYNFDGFLLVIYGENKIYYEYRKLAERRLTNPYFQEIDGYNAAIYFYNNAIIADETEDDEFFKISFEGMHDLVLSKRHTKYPEKVIYLYELVDILYSNYQAKTDSDYQDVMSHYLDFVSKYDSNTELKTFNALEAHLRIINTFINYEKYHIAIKRLKAMIDAETEVKYRIQMYTALCKCYKKIDKEKYLQTLEILNKEYNEYQNSLEENLRDGILNTIQLFETRKCYDEIQKRYEVDQLTGCLNRNVLRKKSLQLFALKSEGSIIFIDLDGLKQTNDLYNHSYGDEYLRVFVRGVQEVLPSSSHMFRFGGDEFVIATSFNDAKRIEKLVKRIYKKFNEPLKICDQYIKIKFSLGVALYPQDGETFEEVLNKADSAMYEDKRRHGNEPRNLKTKW